MSLLRKARTLRTIISGCHGWLPMAAAKLGIGDGGRLVRLKNGLELEVKDSLIANWGQFFEPAVADVYGVAESDADVIIDVGANIGSFSCFAAWTHPKARVFAFEPQDEEIAFIRRNLNRNRLSNVQITESVLTNDGRDVVLYTHHQNVGASNIYEGGHGDELRLKSVTLDTLPFDGARGVFIKLDCEGSEGELIEWLVTHLDRLPEKITVACEYHPWCPVPIEKSVERLTEAGFVVKNELRFDEPYLFAHRSA